MNNNSRDEKTSNNVTTNIIGSEVKAENFQNGIENKIEETKNKDNEVSKLINLFKDEIKESSLSELTKNDVISDITKIEDELDKPKSKQKKETLKHYWNKVFGIVKDTAPLITSIKNIADLLNLK